MKQLPAPTPEPSTQYCESHLTITLSTTGDTAWEVTARCPLNLNRLEHAIRETLASFYSGYKLHPIEDDDFPTLNFQLQCWVMEEHSLLITEVSLAALEILDNNNAGTSYALLNTCNDLVRKVQDPFLKALNRNQITLS